MLAELELVSLERGICTLPLNYGRQFRASSSTSLIKGSKTAQYCANNPEGRTVIGFYVITNGSDLNPLTVDNVKTPLVYAAKISTVS
jgi:hypothetical protein